MGYGADGIYTRMAMRSLAQWQDLFRNAGQRLFHRVCSGSRAPITPIASAPLTETRVCRYENTSSGDFLIDRHPDLENVWLVGGGSGHGFKHGPASANTFSSRILGAEAAEPRFSLAGKAETQSRTVY